MNITQIVSVSDVRNAYTQLKDTTKKKKELETQLEVAKTRMKTKEAQAIPLMTKEDAKNEQTREAFLRNNIPEAFAEIDKLREEVARLETILAVVRIEIEEIKTLISYFTAGTIELVTDYAK